MLKPVLLMTALNRMLAVTSSFRHRLGQTMHHPSKSRRRVLAFAAAVCLAGFTGCQSWVNKGWIAPPGPMNYQQANAIIHDPFPQADLGPDDNSIRPPDYQNPLPLPVRNQMKTQVAPWLGP